MDMDLCTYIHRQRPQSSQDAVAYINKISSRFIHIVFEARRPAYEAFWIYWEVPLFSDDPALCKKLK